MDILQQTSDARCKSCKTCLHILPATTAYFHRDKYSKDGLCSSCKECKNTSRRAYYAQNTEKAKAYSKQYVVDNREHTAQYQKRYAEQHQAELRAYKKAYYTQHQKEHVVRSSGQFSLLLGRCGRLSQNGGRPCHASQRSA